MTPDTTPVRTFHATKLEDGSYVGLCDQYPGLSHPGAVVSDALQGIMELVALCDTVNKS